MRPCPFCIRRITQRPSYAQLISSQCLRRPKQEDHAAKGPAEAVGDLTDRLRHARFCLPHRMLPTYRACSCCSHFYIVLSQVLPGRSRPRHSVR
ncbi:hypothetical protein GY45DRAFT_429596 [Cubamyces sp. BRFM 1775]|nr:hypothetical protein GY45DRAFT_429596 [Cubamyces sp. BRFM 1775]